MQRKCFDTPLQAQELEGIKEIVLAHNPDGVRSGGLTEEGFLYLLTSFIQRGRQETTWTVLRKFGYGEDLKLTEDFLYPKCVTSNARPTFCSNVHRFDVPYDCCVELSPHGVKFLTETFHAFDKVITGTNGL